MDLQQIRSMIRRLVHWYTTPSGLLLAAALLLAAVATLISEPRLALGAVGLMAIFLPYRLSRQQGVAEDRLMAEVARLKSRHVSSENHLVELATVDGQTLAEVHNVAASLEDVRSHMTHIRLLVSERMAAIDTRVDQLTISPFEETASRSELAAIQAELQSVGSRIDEIAAKKATPPEIDTSIFDKATNLIETKVKRLETKVDQLDEVVATSSNSDRYDKLASQTETMSAEIGALAAREQLSGSASGAMFQHFDRSMSRSELAELRSFAKSVGLSIDDKSLGYIGHEVRLTEDLLLGRLAGSLGSAVLRSLVLRAVGSSAPHVLEIGSLFGISIAALDRSCFGLFDELTFTAIDPLDGYYNTALKDILTGVPVSSAVFAENLRRAGIAEDRVRLVQKLSTDEVALSAVESKSVDMLFIDGDHTRFGVEFDYRNYVHAMKLGGFVVLDDYKSKDWPDVEEFVDDELMKDERLVFVGAGWDTVVFRVVS